MDKTPTHIKNLMAKCGLRKSASPKKTVSVRFKSADILRIRIKKSDLLILPTGVHLSLNDSVMRSHLEAQGFDLTREIARTVDLETGDLIYTQTTFNFSARRDELNGHFS